MSARNYFAWRMLQTANEQEARDQSRKLRITKRALENPFNLSDYETRRLKNRYRFSKEAVYYLCEELRRNTNLRSTQRISLEEKVLIALYFYAHGCYQNPVGAACNVSQKTCSKYISQVTEALTHPSILEKYIKFPESPAARQEVSQSFFNKFGIPGVIGCVDGSHFRIVCPPKAEEHLYYCRKHYHSINVQMVCDSECRILSVNPKFGGANHDSFIWENSQLNRYIQNLHQNREMVWLLADSGYAQRPWIHTPYTNPTPDSIESRFNDKNMTARVKIENTFGRLKNRWRCLSKDRVLHYKPAKCAAIIQACCVLHNLALDFNVPDPEGNIDIGEDDHPNQIVRETSNITNDLIRGRAVRVLLARRIAN